MQFLNYARPGKHLTSKEVCILAIDILDRIVSDLVRDPKRTTSPEFLDWVADEATPLIEMSVEKSFDNPRFVNTLGIGRTDIALAHWVRHWIAPAIEVKFQQSRIVFGQEFSR
jgi:hypothetical protein